MLETYFYIYNLTGAYLLTFTKKKKKLLNLINSINISVFLQCTMNTI